MTYPPEPDPYQPQPPIVPSAPPTSPAGYGPQMPPGPYPPPMYQQVVVAVGPPTSGSAVASLVFGIIGMLGGFCFFGIPCFAAVLCGHVALVETKNGARGGRGLAVAGLIMGYLFVAPAIAVIVMGGFGALLPSGHTSP